MATALVPALPTDPTERIHSLDVLRGLALGGMILVHFHQYSTELGGMDDVVRSAIRRLVETKSHGTFALLFGAGFAIQLRRAEARGARFGGIYLRRLAVLALFGFIAHAGFGFNVLLGYAIWGVPLLLIRRWSTRALIVTAVISAVSVSLYYVASAAYLLATVGTEGALAAEQAELATFRNVFGGVEAAMKQDSYGALLAARLREIAFYHTRPFAFLPGATLALFIAGLLAVRHRILENPRAHTRAILAVMAFGFFSWVTDNWLLPLWTTPISVPRISSRLHYLLGLFRDQWLAFTYAGAALLLLAVRPVWLARLRLVGQAGRMALTNYLVQIAVLDFLFSAYGLGLGGIRPLLVPLAAALLFGAEVAFSSVWLKRFRFGPAEWLWRSLTYGQAQPMRRPL